MQQKEVYSAIRKIVTLAFLISRCSGKLKLRNSLRLKNYIMHCKITLDSMSLESGIELSDSEIPLKFWNRRT